jgi:nucleoside-diphosphate-sugar epimerase
MRSLESVLERETYNLSDGLVYDRYAFANAVKKAGKKKSIRVQLPLGLVRTLAAGMDRLYKYSSKTPVLNLDRVNELAAEDWSVDITKAQQELGFQPVYNLETGMAETLAWYKEQHWI